VGRRAEQHEVVRRARSTPDAKWPRSRLRGRRFRRRGVRSLCRPSPWSCWRLWRCPVPWRARHS
jgi:hypothetical protein